MKDKNTAAILALVLGGIGGHKFYLGQTGWGIAYLLFCWTFIPAFVAFIEFILLLTMNVDTFNARFNPGLALAVSPQNIVVNVSQNASTGGAIDRAAQLRQLHELRTAGALSDTEFDAEKQKLLEGRG